MAESMPQRLEVRPDLLNLGSHYLGATIRGSLLVRGAASCLRCYERH
jgi:hypothetical protein